MRKLSILTVGVQMVDVDGKIRSLECRIGSLKSELAFYIKIRHNSLKLNPFETAYANLGQRQRKILELLCIGNDITSVARQTELTKKGVKWHLTKIYAAFNVSGAKELKAFLETNKEQYEQASNGICPGPAKGSAESSVRRLYSGPVTDSTGVSLPFGKPA